ncbi:MAG: MBL fold metallo-hydrolase [Bryobacteraceae bacterium]
MFIRIRMYRQGLGDAFLLTFGDRHVLIDCGVFTGTPHEAATIRAVADNIAAETKNRLSLLVATHEHWDHLSGFYYAAETFRRMQVDEVWLAWTENPDDPAAKSLQASRHLRLDAITSAVRRLNALGTTAAEQSQPLAATQFGAAANEVNSVLEFFGIDALGAKYSARTGETMRNVASRDDARIAYCEPGTTRQLADLPDIHWHILGPPRDLTLLHQSDPTPGRSEVYGFGAAMSADNSLAVALKMADPEGGVLTQADNEQLMRSHPFDRNYQVPEQDGAARYPSYFGAAESWRRIDHDWLAAASELALQLDQDTNNTSLALAIDLPGPDGGVLLFPADAQVGNWLSWFTEKWSDPHRSGAMIGAADLLARTILYKVGHHASHNGTLREQGLERMTHPNLAAMIPVFEDFARRAKGWDMPAEALYDRLLAKTRGRVLRGDRVYHSETRPDGVSAAEWEEFTRRVKAEDLWIDYVVSSE